MVATGRACASHSKTPASKFIAENGGALSGGPALDMILLNRYGRSEDNGNAATAVVVKNGIVLDGDALREGARHSHS